MSKVEILPITDFPLSTPAVAKHPAVYQAVRTLARRGKAFAVRVKLDISAKRLASKAHMAAHRNGIEIRTVSRNGYLYIRHKEPYTRVGDFELMQRRMQVDSVDSVSRGTIAERVNG